MVKQRQQKPLNSDAEQELKVIEAILAAFAANELDTDISLIGDEIAAFTTLSLYRQSTTRGLGGNGVWATEG